MNICFVMAEGYEELAPEFMEFAKGRGMVGIKGHRLVGGFRASCYNALPDRERRGAGGLHAGVRRKRTKIIAADVSGPSFRYDCGRRKKRHGYLFHVIDQKL